MNSVRRRVGRPSGLVYTPANEQRMMARISIFRDSNVPLQLKLDTLLNESPEDRCLRNYLMAGKERLCVFCRGIRRGITPRSWRNHLFTEGHKEREIECLNGMTSVARIMFFFFIFMSCGRC